MCLLRVFGGPFGRGDPRPALRGGRRRLGEGRIDCTDHPLGLRVKHLTFGAGLANSGGQPTIWTPAKFLTIMR
jgi:hypothetical protein